MASSKQYTVLHPVRHDGKYHARNVSIKLGEEDAQRLLDRGVIAPGAPVVEAGPSAAEVLAFSATVNAMKNAELIEYAKAKYDLTLAGDDKRESIVAALHAGYLANYVSATEAA